MKKYSIVIGLLIIFSANANSQNLIKNPNFEEHWGVGTGCGLGFTIGLNNKFDTLPNNSCGIKDWIAISQSPDGFWYNGYDFPINWLSHYLYPHSDSVCVGGGFLTHAVPNLREIIEGRLTKPLIVNHHYQFSMYVQLFDSIPWNDVGKIVGCNSFSALFTDTAITSVTDLPIQNYHPQIQIDSMVVDTQHWVLLVDTFIAAGGEQFVSIGNFKTDAQTQTQLVKTINNKPEVAYYFIDDASLIDLDEVGIEEVEKNKLVVYPNPVSQSLVISQQSLVNTIEITDMLGRVCAIPPFERGLGGLELNTENLPSGIYFIKSTDTKGNTMNGKFVKE
ncbi:MAG: hypothetical protein RJA07_2796 [Bacteroidota bacterium]|jgi:hypothetical protein